MKCRMCRAEKAEVHLRSHNLALCRDCFFEFFTRRVRKAIAEWKMFAYQDKVLVAVSGGKDSLALWDILLHLGYQASGFHIDLGINGYSARSRGKVEEFAAQREAELIVREVQEALGEGIPGVAQRTRRNPCSVCGTVKRYLMNQVARGFDCIATGHNLDDEAAALLGNLLHWQEGYLVRQAPVLEEKESLKKRVKPLVLCSERETAIYAFLRGIDYIYEECPHAVGATTLFYKGILNQIEEKMPGTKLRFYTGFLQQRETVSLTEEELELCPCSRCGYLTSAEICAFCRLKERVKGLG